MPSTRRDFFRTLGAGVIAGAAAPALRGFPIASETEHALWGNSVAAADATTVNPILLYRNENPYGPSEKVLRVLSDSATVANRYPRTEYDILLDKLAAQHRVKREQIVLGCGSGEILCMAAMAFLKPGKKLVEAAPTFPALGKLAQNAGIEVSDVPLNKWYAHDLPIMLGLAMAPNPASTGLVYIVNPNNPTGSLTPRKEIELFLAKLNPSVPVLIDEAYHHFVSPSPSYESLLDSPIDDPRLIVARTFSKIYGLAGVRIGYAVASPEMAKRLAAGFPAWSVSVISARAASAALDDVDYVRLGVKRNADDRAEFMAQTKKREIFVIDSHTNFMMLDPQRPPDDAIKHLKTHNILIGPKYPVLDKYIRVSLGTPTEMKEFWRVWDLLPPAPKMST
jgi:histidinol-phosphate aminotransferase